jgi:FG-GAP repeat
MRRRAWFVAVVAAVALVLPSGGPAVAQVTAPGPDFNNDGFGDLAVGVPGEDLGTATDAGAVSVLYGSSGGLASDGQVLSQDTAGVPGVSEDGDRFGAALVAGEFNGDAFGDLVVGAPGEDLSDVDAGAVTILFGSAGGLGGAGARLVTQENPEPGDSFGFSLDVGEIGDPGGQLMVGAPGEDVGSAADAGAVSLIDSPAGAFPDQVILYQGVTGVVGPVAGTAEAGDAFGWAIVSNDFNDSAGLDSMAIGAPGEDVGAVVDAGAVIVRYAPGFGGPVGLTVLTQDRPETGDRFGSALGDGFLAASDGTVDLAVGAPRETVGGRPGAGAVSVVKNDDSGFLAAGSQLFYQGAAGVPGTAETGDGFGSAVAVGSYGQGVGGLAVGVPGEDIGAVADAGALNVLYGLDGVGTVLLTQQDAAGTVEAGDAFGAALSDPFFHEDDVLEDLGVGAPGETVGGRGAAGAGGVLFGDAADGLGGGGSQFFYQGVSGLGGVAESTDVFGAALG